ncbi:unnamed protein product [Ixodes hexagonus]
MAASIVDDLISVRSHRRLNLHELIDNLPKQLTKEVLHQLRAAVADCDPERIPQNEGVVSSLLAAVLDDKAVPLCKHLALSILEGICPQYGLEEMLVDLPIAQLALFLNLLLVQGTDSLHYRTLLNKLLSALEDSSVGCDCKREVLLYLTQVVEADGTLFTIADTQRVLRQMGSWLLDCSLFSSPRLLNISLLCPTGPPSTQSRFRRTDSPQPTTELDGVVSKESFTVLSSKFNTADQSLNIAAFSVLCVWLKKALRHKHVEETLLVSAKKYCLYVVQQTYTKPLTAEDLELQQCCLVEAVNSLDLLCQLDASLVPEVVPTVQRLTGSYLASHVVVSTALLQFLLHHGAAVLFNTDEVLSQFFERVVSRAYWDAATSLEVVRFVKRNLEQLCLTPGVSILEKYFPALLKTLAWSPQNLRAEFEDILPAFMSPKTSVEVFYSLADLPTLTAALVIDSEMSSSPESVRQKRRSSLGPEFQASMMFVLRDESGIGDTFDGIARFHGLVADLAAHPRVIRSSEHGPRLLSCFFNTFVCHADAELAARLLPAMLERLSVCFGSRGYCERLRKAFADVLPKLFRKFPEMTFLLSPELVDYLSHTTSYDTSLDFFTNLVWAVGEFASPNETSLFTPRVITDYFEVLECVTFELLGSAALLQRERRLRLLCVLITSLCKLAVRSQDLVPRALLCLSKTGQVCGTRCSGPRAVLERRVAELRAVLESSGAASTILTPPKEDELKRCHRDLTQLPALVRLVSAVMVNEGSPR